MDTIKNRNGKDLTEAEEIKKSWEEYTEEWYKKGLDDPGNYNGMVIHLEPDILECEIKRALGNISGSEVKASACNAGDLGSIPGSGRSPGEGNGNPLQYPCLENPLDRGAWWATVYGVTKSRTWLSDWTELNWVDSAKFGNSAVATGLEKISFLSNPKEEQFQRKLKLLYNCVHFTY